MATRHQYQPAHWPPRPTSYCGVQMRSRLEAAWAEQLDAIGLKWEYEPQCYASPEGQYLPDFIVRRAKWVLDGPEFTLFLEVKTHTFLAAATGFEECGRMLRILRASVPDAVLIIGTNAAPDGLVRMAEVLDEDPSRASLDFFGIRTPPVASLYTDGWYREPLSAE